MVAKSGPELRVLYICNDDAARAELQLWTMRFAVLLWRISARETALYFILFMMASVGRICRLVSICIFQMNETDGKLII